MNSIKKKTKLKLKKYSTISKKNRKRMFTAVYLFRRCISLQIQRFKINCIGYDSTAVKVYIGNKCDALWPEQRIGMFIAYDRVEFINDRSVKTHAYSSVVVKVRRSEYSISY